MNTQHVTEISMRELHEIGGGDWYSAGWGFAIGAAVFGGFTGGLGFAFIAGGSSLGLLYF